MVMTADRIGLSTREPKETSLPLSLWLPEEFKAADINPKKGIITSYLTVYNDPSTGRPFVDSYLDIVEPGSFTKTIKDLNQSRAVKNNPYLCAALWQHDRKELIGGIVNLTEDSRGIIYESQLNMAVQRAREAFALAEAKMIGSSYGYDPIRFQHKGDIRHLLEIRLHEVSLVSFPANPHAGILDTKEGQQKFYVPSNLPEFPSIPGEDFEPEEEVLLEVKAICGSTGLAIGPRDEEWNPEKALEQYKTWYVEDGKAIAAKWKQVHLQVQGDPTLPESYAYPFCYIEDNQPRICVSAVQACVAALKSIKDGGSDTGAMLAKCSTLYSRINTKYPDAPKLEVPQDMVLFSAAKYDDFATAWTRRAPSALMQQFFKMTDILTMVLLQCFNDDELDDKVGMVDTCTSQFADQVKEWYPEYAAADAAQDSMEDDDNDNDMSPLSMIGLYSADLTGLNLKRTLDYMQSKAGRELSDKNRQRLSRALDAINQQLADLHLFLQEVGGEALPESIDDTQTPKAAPPSAHTQDITQGMEVLSTLARDSNAPQTPQEPPSTAPMSFPELPETGEYDITDLLASIQSSMTGGAS